MPVVTRSARKRQVHANGGGGTGTGTNGGIMRDGVEVVPLMGKMESDDDDEYADAGKKSLTGSPSLAGDYSSIALLLLLYTLQGIPLGLSESVSYLLQEKGISYEEQGIFDSVSWPFSLKLLWAPIVDACYVKAFGRRKTWLIPVQLLIGACLVLSPSYVDNLMGGDDGQQHPQVWKLTTFFFSLYFLCATQDIAVDGWALTMLSKKNVAYASVCNAAGQTFGFFLAFTGFLSLNTYGLTTLSSFMFYSGVVFLATTFGVWMCKAEKMYGGSESGEESEDMTIFGAYGRMAKVFKLKSIQLLTLLMLTRNIGFSATDKLPSRKLIERGMKKEHLATLMALITPLTIAIPGIISRRVGSRPMHFFMKAYLPRLAVGILAMALIAFAPDFKSLGDDEVPYAYMAFVLIVSVIHAVFSSAMFVAIMAFFAKISDPTIGGTYMTLLNTITNLGSKWPGQLVLFLVEPLTIGLQCTTEDADGGSSSSCSSAPARAACIEAGGECSSSFDGFYTLSLVCMCGGAAWFVYFRSTAMRLERLPPSRWAVSTLDATPHIT